MLEEVLLGVGRRQGGCAFVGCGGLTVSTQPTKQIRSRGVERVVVVQVELVHQLQRCRGASHLADGDRAEFRWAATRSMIATSLVDPAASRELDAGLTPKCAP